MHWLVLLVVAIGCSKPAFRPPEAAHLEASALAVGATAPSSQLPSASGKVALGDVIRDHDKTIVVFYRGFY